MSVYVIKVWAIYVQNKASLQKAPFPHVTALQTPLGFV